MDTLVSEKLTRKKAGSQVTAQDVANDIGVSLSAVSRTFTPGASVSRKMDEKVRESAKRLGYRPNALARSLMTRKTNLIGILIKDFDNPIYLKIIDELSCAIQQRGLQALLINMAHTSGVSESVRMIMQYQVDGLIETSGSAIDPELTKECQRVNTPLIQFGFNSKVLETSAVCCDNFVGGVKAAESFYNMGYKRLAYIGGDNGVANQERLDGFSSVVMSNHNRKSVILEMAGDWTYQAGYDAACRLLKSKGRPDAIFCGDDIIAMGVMDAARSKFNIKVPEELGIIGFDDIILADSHAYSLSTIQQPYNQMIEGALDLLSKQIAQPDVIREVRLFPARLVERESHRRSRT